MGDPNSLNLQLIENNQARDQLIKELRKFEVRPLEVFYKLTA